MRIPEIADRLRALAGHHGLDELNALADALRRRRPERRAPASASRMTPALRAQIRAYAATHPGRSYARIAEHFGVNIGRVSETSRGFRQ